MKTMQYGAAMTLALTAQLAQGFEPVSQTVEFGIYVPPIVQWLNNVKSDTQAQATLSFPYDPEHPERNQDSVTFRLILNVDVVIRADVTPYANVDDPTDTLATEWQIQDDRDGDPGKTGALPADADPSQGWGAYVPADRFLRGGSLVTHQPGDGAVKFHVTARGTRNPEGAENPSSVDTRETADPQPNIYAATVVLTALPQAPTFDPALTGANYAVLR